MLALEARELGVTVKLNTEATPETVAALHPVGVFLAAGAPPVVPKSIPGIDKAVLAEDVILGKAPCTGKVVLVGTGLTGLECAEMILEQGHSLAMVEMNPTVGQGIFGVVFNDIYSRIKPYDPEVYTSHRLTAVTDTGVTVEDMATGETKTIAADTVVLAMGTHSQETMEASYRAAGLNAILVGSAEVPGALPVLPGMALKRHGASRQSDLAGSPERGRNGHSDSRMIRRTGNTGKCRCT